MRRTVNTAFGIVIGTGAVWAWLPARVREPEAERRGRSRRTSTGRIGSGLLGLIDFFAKYEDV
jgi:hypothetical protein